MLSPSSFTPGALPVDLTLLAPTASDLPASDLPAAVAGAPFADLLATQGPPLPDAEAPSADLPAETQAEVAEPAATDQTWALHLVPELALLSPQLPPVQTAPAPAPAQDAAPLAVAPPAGPVVTMGAPWPLRTGSRPLPPVTALVPASDPERPRGWQATLPAAPMPLIAPATLPPVPRTVTSQPQPAAPSGLPPRHAPETAPPPAWSDPTRPPPLWYDPTKLPPAGMDPARIPAAGLAPAQTLAASPPPAPAPALQGAQTPSPPAPARPVVLPLPALAGVVAPPPLAGVVAPPPLAAAQPLRARRLPAGPADAPSPAPVAVLPPALASAAPASFAPAAVAPQPVAPGTPAAAAATDPALAISSDRLGDVAVRLSGSADQLQVAVQAQPAAAAVIGADAPRLSQDLAAAGVALAGLSVNGQRADLSGGQRERQRPPSRRVEAAPLAGARRLSERAATRPDLTIDRFA